MFMNLVKERIVWKLSKSAKGLSKTLSPLEVILLSSTVMCGNAFSILSFTWYACQRARSLARVAMVNLFKKTLFYFNRFWKKFTTSSKNSVIEFMMPVVHFLSFCLLSFLSSLFADLFLANFLYFVLLGSHLPSR